jgi:excisionase family DNA binding protein
MSSTKSSDVTPPRKRHTTAVERGALRRQLPPPSAAQAYPVEPDALAYLGCSRKEIYRLKNAGLIQFIKRGRRVLIPGSELIRLAQAPA